MIIYNFSKYDFPHINFQFQLKNMVKYNYNYRHDGTGYDECRI